MIPNLPHAIRAARRAPRTGNVGDLRETLIEGNRRFVAEQWDQADSDQEGRPRRSLAVLACMDTGYNVEKGLGLEHGDAKIIRNVGNAVDDGTLRTLSLRFRGVCVTFASWATPSAA